MKPNQLNQHVYDDDPFADALEFNDNGPSIMLNTSIGQNQTKDFSILN